MVRIFSQISSCRRTSTDITTFSCNYSAASLSMKRLTVEGIWQISQGVLEHSIFAALLLVLDSFKALSALAFYDLGF